MMGMKIVTHLGDTVVFLVTVFTKPGSYGHGGKKKEVSYTQH